MQIIILGEYEFKTLNYFLSDDVYIVEKRLQVSDLICELKELKKYPVPCMVIKSTAVSGVRASTLVLEIKKVLPNSSVDVIISDPVHAHDE